MSERSGGRTGGCGRRADLWVALALAAVTLAVRVPDLPMPLERDEGEYAYAAQELARGFPPFATTFCQKPPVIFLWYRAALALPGNPVISIHLALALVAWLGALGLYGCARGFGGRGVSALAGLLFALASAGAGYFGSAANTEIFMLAPALWGGALALSQASRDRSGWRWVGVGVLWALAGLTKQIALFTVAPLGVLALARLVRRGGGFRRIVGAVLGMAGGGVLTAVVFGAWLLASGGWDGFLDSAVRHNLSYSGAMLASWKLRLAGEVWMDRFLLSDGMLWLVAVAGGCMAAGRRFRASGAGFGGVWLAVSALGVLTGPYAFGHYFLQVVPPLALGAAATVGLLVRSRWAALGFAAAGLVLGPMIGARVMTLKDPVDVRCARLYGVYGVTPFVAAEQVSSWLARNAPPDARLLIIGSEPEILVLSGLRSVTRYTIFYPLSDSYPGVDARWHELDDELRRNPPEFIVMTHVRTSFIMTPGVEQRVSALLSGLAARYRPVRCYVARDGAGAGIEAVAIAEWGDVEPERVFTLLQRSP